MQPNQITNVNFTTKQLKLPLEIEKIIDISDPVYTFCDVMNHIHLKSYFVEEGYKTGRPRCDSEKLLKVILSLIKKLLDLIQILLYLTKVVEKVFIKDNTKRC